MTNPVAFARRTLETADRIEDQMATALDLLLMHTAETRPVPADRIDYLNLTYGSQVALEELLIHVEDRTAL